MIEKIKILWQSGGLFKISTGVIVGAVLGYSYYYFIGCKTGTCAITGHPLNSTLYGAVMGLLLTFTSKKKD
ncbi:MAG: hypothetical protein HQ562_01630 [Candidatus Marinimicrobia bacterium]|nr:hypothetical protein [Candidatus Neomarinimicrobiota bacterium]